MTSTSTTLARLLEDWPGWGDLLGERRLTVPEILRAMDADRIRVEEYREDGTVVVRAELPGMDPEKDIEVSVTEGILHIRAHREERTEEREEGRVRSEFHYGSFTRSLPLPEGTAEDAIEATYTDGILEVRFPYQEQGEATPKAIPVTRG